MTVATWFRSHRWSVWIVTLLAAVVVGCSTPGNVAAAGSNATTAPMTVMATTQSSVGLATIQENELPTQARQTLKLIDSGGPFPFSRDGIVYHNNSGALLSSQGRLVPRVHRRHSWSAGSRTASHRVRFRLYLFLDVGPLLNV